MAEVMRLKNGDIDREAVRRALAIENPKRSAVEVRVYVDALCQYLEASDNLARLGAVCAHPQTGAPIENPYLRVQSATSAVLSKLRGIQAASVLAALEDGPRPGGDSGARVGVGAVTLADVTSVARGSLDRPVWRGRRRKRS